MQSRSLRMPSRNNGPPCIWDTHGISGNVVADPTASSSAPYLQESSPRVSDVSELTSPHVVSECQTPVQDQERYQSRQSARNSVVPSEGRFSQNYGADHQRLQISDLHFDKFPSPTEVFCKGIQMPKFEVEVLDAKIASTLNRIIHNTQFKRRVSLEEQKAQKEDRFFRGRQIAYLYEYPGHWSQRFCRELCRPVHNYSSKWWYSGIRFEMGRNSTVYDENPIWWCEKVCASPPFPQKISFENNWMKERVQKLLEPKTKNPIVRTGCARH